ncbi:MAG: UDP-glucose 4-epimerase GalE [Candidatus Binatia bacterium]|nr:UDP-glucose 4-epimerase GalE [Candidatus Binatia bacterium]MDG1959338.1 UDP-glucose 4-epimerase GalE [Candidatus Binatia bacterium]MDG2010600.1 UDP-glucose 4-epimerase GalE [Candidatus Binatia bacterium]HAC80731.1 UDP-glucose 4-epimerase GalE [Deltaproteobacteria bacterium]
MRILVTGGAGYVGSHCAKLLKRAGHEVVVLDNLSRGHREAVRFGPLIDADLRDGAAIRAALQEHPVDAVIHFAALAAVGESMAAPELYFENNVHGTLNLLEAMRQQGIDKIVFSSTCATYGIPQEDPISEATQQNPVSPYGETKLMVEQMLRWYGTCHGLRWAALRYFNVAGCDPEGELGEEHDPETHLIPLAIDAALGKRPPLEVFGDDYATPDGTAIRDYIHVWDLVEAHRLALEKLCGDTVSFACNLGTGTGASVRQVLAAVEEVTGHPVPHNIGPRRAGDPPSLVAAPEKANKILDWSPTYPSLVDSVRHTLQWRQKR